MSAAIEIREVSKYYGTRRAVHNLSLEVMPGEIFGFVGPNGAGKTSTIRMMTTLLRPSAGEIFISGHSVAREPRLVRGAIGYMPDFFGVYHGMKVWEYLDFFAGCYNIPEDRRASLVGELLELVDLDHRREDWVEKLSRGMKQRLSLARSLVHDPQVLILDEPASGLDPRARVEIRELLVELARMGKTVFFSTHILSDVSEIASRVAILEAGELVALGALEELQSRLMPRRSVELTLLDRQEAALAYLENSEGVSEILSLENGNGGDRRRLVFQFQGDDQALSRLLAGLVQQEIPVLHFSEDRRDLESVFLQVTKGVVS